LTVWEFNHCGCILRDAAVFLSFSCHLCDILKMSCEKVVYFLQKMCYTVRDVTWAGLTQATKQGFALIRKDAGISLSPAIQGVKVG
jgi:hypothetical protein